MDTTTEAQSTADPPPEPPPSEPDIPPPSRRILRSRRDRVLGGVAAGIAEHFSIDPMLVRLGFVVAAFFGGIGVLAYIVAWIAMPDGPVPTEPPARRDNRQLIGYAFVALGLAVLPGPLGVHWNGAAFWPIALITIGGAVLWLRTRDSHQPAPTDTLVDPAPPAAPSTALVPVGSLDEPVAPAPVVDASHDATTTTTMPMPVPVPLPPTERARRAPRAPKPSRPRSHLTAITLSALLVVVGAAWLLDLAGVITIDVGVMFAIALAVVGAGLVASAWYGRARGLIPIGILLALIVGAFGVIDVPLRGGLGDTTYRGRSVADVDRNYEMAIGRLTVDLGDVDLSGRRRTVTTTLGVGKLEVIVPDGARVVVDGHAGVGSVHAFDRRTSDCCPVDVRTVHTGDSGGGTLRLTAKVGAGDVEIRTRDQNQEDTRGTP